MRILLIGQNPENPRIARGLAGEGREVILLDALEGRCSLSGQAGDFTLNMAGGDALSADFVVLTQQPAPVAAAIDGGLPRSLYEPDKNAVLLGNPQRTPVVFLLDYECESPLAATVRALADARELAAKKRPVYCAARFIRTAGRDTEAAYAAAREAGVTFIKYRDIRLSYDKRTDRFGLRASDGAVDYLVEDAILFADGGRDPGMDFSAAADVLRLHADSQGYTLEDRHFLAPALTSRRGVFQVGRDAQAESLADALAFIDEAIGAFAPGQMADTPQATIDGERCVFCYNCYRACPHAALAPDTDARRMAALAEACEGCGTCVAVCPGDAITLGERVEKKEAAADEAMLYGKLLVLACENGAALVLPDLIPQLGDLAEEVDVRPLPCGGDIGLEDVSEALLDYEKVLVAICPDDACKHFDGNRRAKLQCGRLADMLEKAGLEPGRVRIAQVSHAMPRVLRDEILAFATEEEGT